jgi:hypothetical protein
LEKIDAIIDQKKKELDELKKWKLKMTKAIS